MKLKFNESSVPLIAAGVRVVQQLTEAGYPALFAGGCVRDALCGRELQDIDIATGAAPAVIEELFPGRTVSVGKEFGVIVVREGGFQFDVASFRGDGAYLDGRHPENIHLCSAREDAQRRDFTVNGLFCDPFTGEILDYVGGVADIRAGVVRSIGGARQRFAEDNLRMLRAIRFATVMGFTIEKATWQALCDMAERISQVSIERITVEFMRMLCEAPEPSSALEMLRRSGLLRAFLPEVEALVGVAQPPQFHPEGDVWTHTCMMLDKIDGPRDPALALGVLFHDIGKPATFIYDPGMAGEEGRIRFMGHAAVGAELAEKIMKRLRLPRVVIESVCRLVANHMRFIDAEKMRPSTLRRLLGIENIGQLLELNRLDSLCSNGDLSGWRFLMDKREQFASEPVLPPPLVGGKELIAWGFKPGPAMGRVLRKIYDAQLEGRIHNVEDAKKIIGVERKSAKKNCDQRG
jgi:putative nucleotidyltransferase with HDIG domain